MRVAVTGTPGTGKTTVVERIETALQRIHLNDVIRREGFATDRDAERDSLITDMDALREWLAGRDDVLVESHLAHHFPADRVVVLRCHPEELVTRLRKRGDSETKAAENAEAEAMDVVLSEAVSEHGQARVYEIDTTNRTPDAVAADVKAVIAGERAPSAGGVDFTEYL